MDGAKEYVGASDMVGTCVYAGEYVVGLAVGQEG
jgi:hypothetical protein